MHGVRGKVFLKWWDILIRYNINYNESNAVASKGKEVYS
jgi:hypothetical protein